MSLRSKLRWVRDHKDMFLVLGVPFVLPIVLPIIILKYVEERARADVPPQREGPHSQSESSPK
jgi:hypothetical protein